MDIEKILYTYEDDYNPSSMVPGPRNMYAQGQLVQPNADGSRPGYQGKKNVGSNQYGKFKTDKPTGFKTINEKRLDDYNKKNKYINKLISDANAKDKYTSIGDIAEKVKKQFRLKNAKSINISSFPDLELLESRVDKVDKVLRDMLIDDKPLKGFWHNVISERTGVPINKPGNLRILEQSPSYNSIKDEGLDLLKVNYSRKSFNYLHDFSLSDQLTKALEISKGNPTYIGLGGEKVRTALPSNKIMEFALRSWNNNKGSKTGPIQFFKNGKPIVWEKGIKLPYSDVSFSYNGKMHKKSNLNTDYMKKFFPEVYNNQIAINNLSVKKIDNPLKPGSKISVKDLIKKIQVDSYGWQPRFPTLEIIHGKKGVISEPFSNLTYGTRDLNQLENAVRISMKAGNIKPREGNQLIKDIYSSIQNKTGADLDQSIIDRQVDLAKNKNLTYPRIKEVGVEQFKKDLLKLAGTKNKKCKGLLSYGGRAGLAEGLSPEFCINEGKKVARDLVAKNITGSPAQNSIMKRITSGVTNFAKSILDPKELFDLKKQFLSKGALASIPIFDAVMAADDALRKNMDPKEAFAKTLTFGTIPRAMGFTDSIDVINAKKMLEDPNLSPAGKEYAQLIINSGDYEKMQSDTTGGMTKKFTEFKEMQEKIKNASTSGRFDYENALAEMQGTFKAKPKENKFFFDDAPDAPDVTPLTNKLATPAKSRGPMTEMKKQKVDLTPTTYENYKPFSFTKKEFEDTMRQIGSLKEGQVYDDTFYKEQIETPMKASQFKEYMELPSFRGTQEKFMEGGIASLNVNKK